MNRTNILTLAALIATLGSGSGPVAKALSGARAAQGPFQEEDGVLKRKVFRPGLQKELFPDLPIRQVDLNAP